MTTPSSATTFAGSTAALAKRTPRPRLMLGAAEPIARELPKARGRVRPRVARRASQIASLARQRASSPRAYLFALLPIALIVGAYVYVTGGSMMSTENAYVQADMVNVSTDVSGIVSEIDVKENQKVNVGDILFKLDDRAFRLALDKTNAQLGAVKNELLAAQANYRNMQAQIEQAQTDVAYYDTTFKRQQQLAANSFASQAAFDDARRNLQVAQQKLASLNQQLAGLAASLNGNPDAPVESYPRYKEQLAARDEAARQLEHATVRAPIPGIATKVPSLQPGQYLAASTSAIAVVATDHVWVQANPKETELTYVRPGQKVDRRGRQLSRCASGPAPSKASRRRRPRASRCCRRKIRAATGSRWCNGFRCACASRMSPASHSCASA